VQHDVASSIQQAVADTGAVSDDGRASVLTRALDESMRLYPPTWLYIRNALMPDVLPSGQTIASGDKLYLAPYTLQRLSQWYPDPERFDPERFTVAACRERPRFTYFPFGGGARLCLGEPFARMESRLVLSELLQRFELEPLVPENVPLRPSIVLEPRGGLPMRLRTRR